MKITKSYPIEIEMSIRLRDEDIDDVMCTALEGGVNYWCDAVKVVGKRHGEYASEEISNGGRLLFHVDEPFDNSGIQWYELDLNKFILGIERWAKNNPKDFFNCCEEDLSNNKNYAHSACLDTCEIDAYIADTIIQYALFGEEIFG